MSPKIHTILEKLVAPKSALEVALATKLLLYAEGIGINSALE
ncbi:hypothetical protein [Bacillus sp. WL1]|nr:hypothetical protein [Bacillus sp. WL1]